MKHIIFFLFCSVVVIAAGAQQLQTSSMYDLQGVFHNPSTAGVAENNFIGASYKSQWSGISGSPRTVTAFGSFNLPQQQIGLGGYIFNDKTGPTSRTGLQLAFAKHIATGNNGIFSLGIEARFQDYVIDRSKLSESIGADPALGTADNKMNFDAGFGVSYTGKKLQLGASVSQLVQSKLNFYTGNLTTDEQARLYRHYYLHGLYKWQVDANTVIIPNFLMIYLPNAPTEFQIGARVEHNNIFWWGIGMRVNQSFMLSAGVHANKNITIGYAYDMYKSPLSIFNSGAGGHELLLRYNFVK